ncbi:hypothetical protein Cassandra_0502 [Pseudomonas phage Cassandra]|nr:hypothetical protein Cassandra_0502 [Pseudomonas phage Cassandra]
MKRVALLIPLCVLYGCSSNPYENNIVNNATRYVTVETPETISRNIANRYALNTDEFPAKPHDTYKMYGEQIKSTFRGNARRLIESTIISIFRNNR